MTGAGLVARQPLYRSYLLRLWQVDSDGCLVWHASLEDPHTGERRGFADLNRMLDFLREQTEAPPRAPA
jgi:hypothetical protein